MHVHVASSLLVRSLVPSLALRSSYIHVAFQCYIYAHVHVHAEKCFKFLYVYVVVVAKLLLLAHE